jgi:hypothetical protein
VSNSDGIFHIVFCKFYYTTKCVLRWLCCTVFFYGIENINRYGLNVK